MENDIKLLAINEIIKEKFFIPSYQRGYRWEEQQVADLLEDIWEFSQQERKKDEFYCLQPVVVKKKDHKWELIDGQQRLITIYIILNHLGKKRYEIEFETRKKSKEFLENIDVNNTSNIDFFFIGQAFSIIKEWFEHKENVESEYTIKDEFHIALGKSTKIIWYEVNDESNPIDIFTRLNIGKIPLTNAELIKALFLKNSHSEIKKDVDAARLKQLEIASEWDRIEYALQDDEFWNFINRDLNDMPTRIEFIFNVMANKNIASDEYYTFRYFSHRLEKESVQDIWDEVKEFYMTFEDWFNDRILFHLIGYLVTLGEKIEQLKIVSEGKTKTEFNQYIINRIKEQLKFDISNLDYENNSNEIKKVLLLFNIETILNMKGHNMRFSYDSYKKEKWSIEHIHAQNSEGLSTVKQWTSWIEEHIRSLERINAKKYRILIQKMGMISDKLTLEEFNKIFEEVKDCFKDDFSDDMHLINNLTLLDKDSNSKLNNSFFDVKRNIIIQRDKKGYFVPPCTRNVFLKYYSKNASQLHFWGPEDRKGYFDEIRSTLSKYISQPPEVKEDANY